jgi:hypothetical protein
LNRLAYVLVGGLLVAVAAAAVSLGHAGARQGARFIPISVLAQDHANYGVDIDLPPMAPVSMDIVADTLSDMYGVPAPASFVIPPAPRTDPAVGDDGPTTAANIEEDVREHGSSHVHGRGTRRAEGQGSGTGDGSAGENAGGTAAGTAGGSENGSGSENANSDGNAMGGDAVTDEHK